MPPRRRVPVHHLIWDIDDRTLEVIQRCAHCTLISARLAPVSVFEGRAGWLCLSSAEGHARLCPGAHRPLRLSD